MTFVVGLYAFSSDGLSKLSDGGKSATDFLTSDQIQRKPSLSAERGNDTVTEDVKVICSEQTAAKAKRDDSINR